MPQQKKAKLRSASIGFKLGATGANIGLDITDIPNSDIDQNTPVVIRAFVKPAVTHPGFYGTGAFSANQNGFGYSSKFKDIPHDLTYTPNEKGFHLLILTTVEDGVAHTYRSGLIRVT